jgi:hypothetical protein
MKKSLLLLLETGFYSLGLNGRHPFFSILFIGLFLVANAVTQLNGQTNRRVYSTNFSGSTGAAVSTISGWATSGPANLSLSTASGSIGTYSTPIMASGGANLADIGTVVGASVATLSGQVNTEGLSNIKVIFGARRTTYTGAVTLEWSSDGSAWNSISYTDVANTGIWGLVNGGIPMTLPAGAEGQTNLRFRFTFNRTTTSTSNNYRVDDFSVTGDCAAGAFTATFAGGGSMCIETSRELTGAINSGGVAPFTFELDNGESTSGLSITVSPTATTNYIATITDNRGCVANMSGNPQTVTVNPIPSTPTTADPSAVCFGTQVTVTGTGSTQSPGTVTSYSFWDADVAGNQYANINVLGTIAGNVLTTSTTLAAGTYDVYIQAEGSPPSCPSSRKKVTITILPLPTINTVTQAAAVCTGSTATINLTGLLANSNLTVSYSINGTAQTPVNVASNGSGNGSFTVALTNANNGQTLEITGMTNTSLTPNCAATFTGKTTILSVNPLPTVTLTGGSFNRTQTPTLTATPGFASYVWSGTPSVTGAGNSVTVVPTPAAGIYPFSVQVTDASGCQNTASANVVVYSTILYVNDNVVDAGELTGVVGNNSNSGTITAPLLTIQAAIDAAVPGDEIRVDVGTFAGFNANKAVVIKGIQNGTARCTATSAESIVTSAGTAVTISADNVTIDGLLINGVTGIASTGFKKIALRNNLINAGGVGISAAAIATTVTEGYAIEDNCVKMTMQVAGPNPTVGIYLNGASGSQAVNISNNTVQNGFYGYVLHAVSTTPTTTVSGGSITGVLQGIAVVNSVDNVNRFPSTAAISGVTMSGFSGDHPSVTGRNFHAGIYTYTMPATTAAQAINLTVSNTTINGTQTVTQASAGIYIGDFSVGSANVQTVTVDNCLILNNTNRGLDARGKVNATITNSTFTNNGGAAFGTGDNDGFTIIARQGATVTATNNFITHPATSSTPVTAFITGTTPASTITANNNSVLMNGNANGKGANNSGGNTLSATCNWWGGIAGTVAPLMSGSVVFEQFLTSGTDDVPATAGFQPAAGTCNGCSSGNLVTNTNTGKTFCSIQAAIDDATTLAGHTITASAGTYAENITVNKEVTLKGAKFGTSGCDNSRGTGETIIMAATGSTATIAGTGSTLISVTAANVTIDGFTIDGDNTAITNPFTAFSTNPDVDNGIDVSNNNVIIQNNIVQNIFQFGISAGTATYTPHQGVIKNNKIQRIPYWAGIILYNNYYADVQNNCIKDVWRGIQTNNNHLASPTPADVKISNNTIALQAVDIMGDSKYTDVTGILINNHYQNASLFRVENNTISNSSTGSDRESSTGIGFWSIQSATEVTPINNSITGFNYGVELWNCPTTNNLNIKDGSITNCETGVFANNYDTYPPNPSEMATTSTYALDNVTITGSTTGIHVKDNTLNTNSATVNLEIKGNTNVSSATTGVKIEGKDAKIAFIGTNAATFTTVSGNYIEFVTNGTDVPASTFSDMDASEVTFAGKKAVLMTQAERTTLEGKLTHKQDNTALAKICLPSVGTLSVKVGSPSSICAGESTILTTNIIGATGPFTLVYTDGTTPVTVNSYVSGADISITPSATATYSIVSITDALGCSTTGGSGTPSVSVKPNPTISGVMPSAASVCAGTGVSFTATGLLNGSTIFNYTVNGNPGTQTSMVSGGSITFPSANYPVGTYNIVIVSATVDGCTTTFSANNTTSFTVKPNPTISSVMPSAASVCDGTGVSFTATGLLNGSTVFNYTVNGNPGTQTETVSGGSITFPSAVYPIGTYNIVIVSATVDGCTTTFSANNTTTFTVHPIPTLSSTLTAPAICSGTAFSYTPTSVVSGTTFGWSRAAVAGISQTMATGSDNPNETLTNTTANPVVVTYVYTLTANGCVNTQNVTVTVKPSPTLSSTLTAPAICSATAFSYTPTSATSGTTFSWSRAGVVGINEGPSTGSNNPNETLTNSTANPLPVIYVYTLTADGCVNTQNVTVTVKPSPTLSSTLTPTAICSGTKFNYTPASATTGTTFTWSRAGVVGINEGPSTGSGNPDETLTNSTTGPLPVTYVYTMTADGCVNTQNVTVTVNPTPTPVIAGTLTLTCAAPTTTLSTSGGGTYAWSNGGNGSSIINVGAGTYNVTVTDVNGCVGIAPSVTATYFPVTNSTQTLHYATIQAAINAATNGDLIQVCSGTYDAQLLVNKPVILRGVGATQPVINFTGTVSGKPTLFDVSQPNVTIENFEMRVDLVKLSSGIIASATNINNLTVKGNTIRAIGSSNAANFGTYTDRNAVSINYGGTTNYRLAPGGVNNLVFQNNTVHGYAASDPASGGTDRYFRSAVSLDEGGGSFTGNTLTTINHDVLVRFGSNGAVTISNNNFNGGGVELAEQNAGAGVLTVSNNTFTGEGAPNTAVLRVKNNYNSKSHVISGNTFDNYTWGVSLENMNTTTVDDNTFTTSTANARAIVVNSKSISNNSNTIVQVPVSGTFINNNFNGTGTALTFANHDSDNDSYGSIVVGTLGNENKFGNLLSSFIVLDNQIGSSTGSTFPSYTSVIGGAGAITTMACWDQNLDAQNNKFNVGAGLQLPSAMNLTQRTALEGALVHKPDASCTGLITYFLPVHNVTQGTRFLTIQPAITAAVANDVIELSEWTFNERVTIDKSLTLQGVNTDKSLQVITGTGLAGTGDGIQIANGVTGVTIKNLTVQNFTGASGNANAGIYATGGNNNLTVDNVALLNNAGGSGFYASGTSGISNVSITNSMVSNHSPGARGIVIWNGLKQNITITGNTVTNNSCCGIELQDGDASGVTVSNNVINIGGGDNAIGLVGLNSTIGANIVSNNTITGGGRFGIEIKNPNGGVTVSGNSVSLTTINTDLRDRAGIAVFRRGVTGSNVSVPTGVTVTGNTVSGYVQSSTSTGFGIVVEGTNHSVTTNTVSGCDVGIQQQGGYDPSSLPSDGNQANIDDLYFGRGNSPTLCNVTVSGNTFSSNGTDERIVMGGGIGIDVTSTGITPTVVDPTDQVVCNNGATTLVTFSGNNLPGAIYKWVNDKPSIGLAASGTSATIPTFNAINSSNTTAVVASITVTPSVNGCDGTPQTFTITVNPIPIVTAPSNITVCHNATVAATTLTGNPSGFIVDISGGASVGLANATGLTEIPSFTATNTGTSPVTVTVTLTPKANNCSGSPVTYDITVNPLPSAAISGTTAVCKNGPSPNVTFTGSNGVAPFTFTYKINGGANQTITTTSGNSVTVAAPTTADGVFTYALVSVQESSGTMCSNTASGSAVITVNPLPVVAPIVGQNFVYVGSPITLTNATPGGVWSSVSIPTTAADISSVGVVTGYVDKGTTTISYTVTDGNGCSTTVTKVIKVNLPLLDIGIFNEPAGSDKFVVKVKPTADIVNADYTGGAFTVSVPTSANVSLSAPASSNMTYYYVLTTSATGVSGSNYYAFSSTYDATINMTQGIWYPIATLQHSGSCSPSPGTFTLVTDNTWTNANNGNYYQEVFFQKAENIIDPMATAATAPLDVVPPVLTEAADQNVNLDANCSVTIPDVRGTVTDNCAGTVITQVPAIGAVVPATHNGTITVTVTATDLAGLTDVETVTLTAKDVAAPVLTKAADQNVNLDANCSVTIPDVRGTVTDNCAGTVITQVPATGAVVPAAHNGTITVTVTATDLAGLTDVETVTLTAKDLTAPTIGTAAPVTASINAASCSATVPLTAPTTSDNCNVVSVTNNAPSVFPLGQTTVTWTVTDGAGLTATTTQLVTITTSLAATSVNLVSPAICLGGSTNLSFTIAGGSSPYTVVYNIGSTPTTATNYVSGDPISISPSATTTYTLVSVTDAFGCVITPSSLSATLTVNPVPTLSITQPDAVCVSIDLASVVKTPNITGGSYSYYATAADATNETNPLSSSIVNADGTYHVRYELPTGCFVTGTITVDVGVCIELQAKVMLQGAYNANTGLMREDLRIASLIPLSDPYSSTTPTAFTTAFVKVNHDGIKTVTQAILDNNNIVDWVFLELRSKNNNTQVLATRSALLKSNGNIVDINGTSPVKFLANLDEYFVVVRHRNHLGVSTSTTVNFPQSGIIDFTSPSVNLYVNPTFVSNNAIINQTAPRRVLVPGVLGLWAGDANYNTVVNYNANPNDRSAIVTIVGSNTLNVVPGYFPEDINMNGVVTYNGSGNDRSVILLNLGSGNLTKLLAQHIPIP